MFQQNLKRILHERKITQKQFGEMVGFSQNMICYYLSGRSQPTLEFLTKASKALNVSIDELCREENKEKVSQNKFKTGDQDLDKIIKYYNQLTYTGKIHLLYAAESIALNPALSICPQNKNK